MITEDLGDFFQGLPLRLTVHHGLALKGGFRTRPDDSRVYEEEC
jgi:hypothetical protein